MTTHTRTTTADDLLRMADDGHRYELVSGELRQMAPAGHEHGIVVARLTWRLVQYVEAHRLGAVCAAETGFRLASDPDTVLAPDVAFVRQDRLDAAGHITGYFPGAPDLAVEVVSPSDSYAYVEDKTLAWLQAGTRMVWVVNPRHRLVTVYRAATEAKILTANDELLGDDVIPGWRVNVGELLGP